ncbi:MAG TPA: 5'-deoxyadenosine deaminase [Myxococcales bacterium]|nr:5'-deoxyadenosine deaminase [Myxococcales bacterium]
MILLRGGTVVTMDARRSVLRADVLVDGDRIARIGRGLKAPRVIDCIGKAIVPGFVQAHVHLCQVLFRNHADGLALLDWLSQRIWPYEAAHDARSLGFSARLGLSELLLGGTTAILDMATVAHTEAVLKAAEESGIRYTGGKCLMDAADGPLREDTRSALHEAETLGRKWHGRGRVRWALCPRFALSCSEQLLRSVRELSEREGWLVHTHASENADEVAQVRALTGLDNVAYLDKLGLCGPRTVLAHCVHVSGAEIEALARTRASAVHCPGANLKLASGVAPVPELLARGVNVALGGDGAPCNNTLDAFHEMRLAATLHLPRSGPRAMPASDVLAMATVNGARALGLESEIGSIEPGKKADLAIVDLAGPHCQPAGPDLHATLVYCARASDVTDVLVDGKQVVRGRRLLTLDAPKLAAAAAKEAQRVLFRAATTGTRGRSAR